MNLRIRAPSTIDHVKAPAAPARCVLRSASAAVPLSREAGPAGNPAYVGVDRHPLQAEGHAPDDVRRLAADTGDRNQVGQGRRDLPAIALLQRCGHAEQASGLGPEEAGRVDEPFDLGRVGVDQFRGGRVAGEQGGRD